MRRIILSCVACPAVPYFCTLPHKRYDFSGGGGVEELWGKCTENENLCFDFLYKFSQKNLSLKWGFNQILSSMYVGINFRYPLFLPDFHETWFFSTGSRKTRKYQI